MSATKYPLVYTVAETAVLLGMSRDALYDALATGALRSSTGRAGDAPPLPYVATRGRISIPKAAVAAFLGVAVPDCDACVVAASEVNVAAGAVPAAPLHSVPPMRDGGANLGKKGGKENNVEREMDANGLPERTPGGRRTGGAVGGHRRAPAHDGAGRDHPVAAGAPA